MKWSKKKTAVAGVVGICAIASLFSGGKNVETINLSIPDYQEEYDINTDIPVEIVVEPEDADTNNLEYETDSHHIDFSESGIYTGNSEGTYKVYVSSGDIQSNTLSITVVDMTQRAEEEAKRIAEEQRLAEEKAAKEAEEKRLAEEKAAKEAEEKRLAEEKAAREAEEKRLAEEQAAKEAAAEKAVQEAASNANNSAVSNTPSAPSGNSNLVWIPKSGSKYHSNSSCSNMKNPSQVTLEQAQAGGYGPCKKCY